MEIFKIIHDHAYDDSDKTTKCICRLLSWYRTAWKFQFQIENNLPIEL
jgi:hypothetical protein